MTLRVAILGAGIGAEHLRGYTALPDRWTVTQICDRDLARATALAEPAGAAATADVNACLADPAVDVVDVCLPPHLHAPITKEALRAGKHVICEKPLAGSLAEARAVADAARAAGRSVFPVFQYRYGRAMTVIAALKDANLLGRPHAAALLTHWNRGAQYYVNPWRGTWRHELGGVVLSHAIHVHDLLSVVFGPIARVSATLATRVNAVETEDCAAITFETDDGALATSSVTLGSADDMTMLRLVFADATVESGRSPYTPAAADWTIRARDPERQATIDAAIAAVAHGPDGFSGYLADVADALDGRPNTAVCVMDGVRSLALATAIYHADRTGTRVDVAIDASLPIASRLAPAGSPLA